jgi:hypothetical protein
MKDQNYKVEAFCSTDELATKASNICHAMTGGGFSSRHKEAGVYVGGTTHCTKAEAQTIKRVLEIAFGNTLVVKVNPHD